MPKDKTRRETPYYVTSQLPNGRHRVSTELGYFHADTPEALREKVQAARQAEVDTNGPLAVAAARALEGADRE
jgi:hypothetical protein